MNKKLIIITSSITAIVTILLTSLFYFSSLGVNFVGIISGSSLYSSYGKFRRIEKLLEANYMGEYSPQRLVDGALKGYVSSLGDPYSSYFTKSEFEELNSQLNGVYQGIGITIKNENEHIVIKEVNPGSPAEKAGILKEDIILSVNGVAYSSDNLNGVTGAIKNTKLGETVELTLARGDNVINVNVTVEKISERLIIGDMLENNIGYIHISSFSQSVSDDFSKEIEHLKKDGMKGLIIDLRNNPGGILDAAVKIADILLPEGTITTVRYKDKSEEVYSSDKKELGLPICVLVNENSASASEVLSGALHDHGKAVIIGKKTFGKGVVQSVVEFGDGSGLSLTVAKYYTPSGVCINGIGIAPDIEVDLPAEAEISYGEIMETDIQLLTAIENIKVQINK